MLGVCLRLTCRNSGNGTRQRTSGRVRRQCTDTDSQPTYAALRPSCGYQPIGRPERYGVWRAVCKLGEAVMVEALDTQSILNKPNNVVAGVTAGIEVSVVLGVYELFGAYLQR